MDEVIPGTPEWDRYHAAVAQMDQDPALAPEHVELVPRVTAAVADGLSRIVPPGFEVYASHGIIGVGGPGSRLAGMASGTGFAHIVASQVNSGTALDRALIAASLAVLSGVQDGVAEELRVPWPADPGGGPSAFAVGCVESVDGVLRLWFASSDGVPVTDIVSVVVGPAASPHTA